MLRCKDGSLYTGVTIDLEKRIQAHNAGTGAKYTRGRGPVRLVWSEKIGSEGEAKTREAELKKLTRREKEELITS